MAQEVISALTITEKWIKSKVGMKHDNLDDVKSLSLPGSSNEKIVHLGNALQGFTRLKHLDLSRNNISVLDGLEHLKMLETLVLYYNSVSSLKELYKLRYNMNLKELDIRLNPITKLEPEYRLFAVHMLPNLKSLDDRPVRDSDRKAALEHFTTDQASDFEVRKEREAPKLQERVQVPRVDVVQRLGSRPSALGDEEVAVIDLISRGNSVWKVPSRGGGSRIERPSMEDYTKEELKSLDSKANVDDSADGLATDESLRHSASRHSHSHNSSNNQTFNAVNQATPYLSYAAFSSFTATPNRPSHSVDSSPSHVQRRGKVDDDDTDYPQFGSNRTAQKDNGHAAERADNGVPTTAISKPKQTYTEYRDGEVYVRSSRPAEVSDNVPACSHVLFSNGELSHNGSIKDDQLHSRSSINPEFEAARQLLQNLLALVDRYWNGTKSLQKNFKFQGLALKLIASFREEASVTNGISSPDDSTMQKLEDQISRISELEDVIKQKDVEIESLGRKLQNDKEIQETLKMANNDMALLHSKLTQFQAENMELRSKVSKLEAGDASKEILKKELAALQAETTKLEAENVSLNRQCQQQGETLSQLQELTSMLQESHRSLVVTNDHLLQEIHEEKQRHQHEVNQLHWSYEQLKKTAEWLPKVSR